MTDNPTTKSHRSISAILVITLAAVIMIGIGAMVILGASNQREAMDDEAAAFREIMTRQLGAQMTGGLRWNRTNAIEAVYNDLVADEAAEIANIAVYDSSMRQVVTYASETFAHADMASLDASIEPVQSRVFDHGDHMVAISSVDVAGKQVGVVAVAFAMESIDQKVWDGVMSQTFSGAVVVVLAISVLIALVTLLVGKPLRLMSGAMASLAAGDLSAEIPGMNRNDEIGSMAVSDPVTGMVIGAITVGVNMDLLQ